MKKQAFNISDFYEASKDYITSYINPNNPTKGLFNIISTYAVSGAFASLFSGSLIAKAAIFFILHLFNVDFAELVGKICDDVRSLVASQGNKTSPQQVQRIVDQHVDAAFAKTSPEEATKNLKTSAYYPQLTKNADLVGTATAAGGTVAKGASTAAKALKFSLGGILGALLGGMGLTLFSDFIASSVLDIKTPFDKLLTGITTHTSRQTKYKINPSYTEESPLPYGITVWGVQNNVNSIQNLLINWTHQIYEEVKDVDILQSESFHELIDKIIELNYAIGLKNAIQFPNDLRTKKQAVDQFIDEVASKSSAPAPAPVPAPAPATKAARKLIFNKIIKSN